MASLDDKDYAAALLKEYERVCTEIRSIELANDKVIGFGLTILGVGFAYGIGGKVDQLLFFLPVGFAGVFLYATLQYHNLFWFGGYKRFLEDRLNRLYDRPVISWEAIVAQRPRVHVINGTLVAVYFLVASAATIYSLTEIINKYSPLTYWPFTAVVVGLFVAILFSVRRMARAFREAYEAGTRVLNSSPGQPD